MVIWKIGKIGHLKLLNILRKKSFNHPGMLVGVTLRIP